MSAPANANPCCSTNLTTQIPGSPGADGAAGAAGLNAWSITQASFVVPAVSSSVSITVDDNSWAQVNQIVFESASGYYQVNSKSGTTVLGLTYLNYSGNTHSGDTVASGAEISPAGAQINFSSVTALTDNTGGAASDTLAAGVGISLVALFVNLADIAAHDLLTAYTPGFNFEILAMDFIVEKAATTAAKLATLTPYISAVAVTGGVIALASANCTPQGAIVSGSTVTANNTGGASATISITGSAVTTFVEGSGWIMLKIKDVDAANAFASLAAKVNAIIAAT